MISRSLRSSAIVASMLLLGQAQAQQPEPTAPVGPHPWLVQPQHGSWMICVKSYTGPESKKYAEALANDIRQTYKTPAYLFEWGKEKREEEEARLDEVRKRYIKEKAPFFALQEEMKKKAEAEGLGFMETPVTIEIPIIKYETQWAVLVGGFKDMESAAKNLQTMHTWPAPKNAALMDTAIIAETIEQKDGGVKLGGNEQSYINPFRSALVVPNPSIERKDKNGIPFASKELVEFNSKEEYSIFQARKPWTLMVKRFSMPKDVLSRHNEDKSILEKIFVRDEAARVIHATNQQAHVLAEAIRHPSMQKAAMADAQKIGLTPRPLVSFVLHARTESLVTVGEFDGPDDPALAEMWRILNNMQYQLYDKDGKAMGQKVRMFDVIIPMPVPKVQP